MLDFEILGIKSQNQLNPCAVPSDAVKMEAKNTAPLEYIGESEELWDSECDRQDMDGQAQRSNFYSAPLGGRADGIRQKLGTTPG